MRLSVNRHDPGFHEFASFYEVLVDGKLIENCITADEQGGYCWCHIPGPLPDRDFIPVRLRRGRVEIRLGPHLPVGLDRRLLPGQDHGHGQA